MALEPQASFDFRSYWTPLTRNVIVGSIAIYVVQLLSGGVMEQTLGWPASLADVRPWQMVTSFLLSSPEPMSAVFTWLALFFFLGQVDVQMGRRPFVQAMGLLWSVSVVLTLGMQALGLTSGIHYGLGPFVTALVAFFGFRNPNAQVYFYLFPIRGIWLARAGGFIALLMFLRVQLATTTLDLLFWVGAWLWVKLADGGVRRWQLRRKRADVERRLGKFQVFEGGRSSGRPPDPWVH